MSDIEPIGHSVDTMSDLDLCQLYEEDEFQCLLEPTVSEDSADNGGFGFDVLYEGSPSFDLSPFPISKSSDSEVAILKGPSRYSGRKKKRSIAKRSQSAFNVFFSERKAQIDRRIPKEEIVNIIASQWHDLSPEEYDEYECKARRNFRDFRKNMRKNKHIQRTASEPNLSPAQSPDLFTAGPADSSTKAPVEAIATPSPTDASLEKAEPVIPATPVKHLVTPIAPIRPHASPVRAALPENLLPVGLSHSQGVTPSTFYSKRFGPNGTSVSSLPSPQGPLLARPARASLPGYCLDVPSLAHIGRPLGPSPSYYPQACNRPVQPVAMPSPIYHAPSRTVFPEGQEVVLPDQNGHPKRYRVQYKCVRMSRAEAERYMARSWQPSLPSAQGHPY